MLDDFGEFAQGIIVCLELNTNSIINSDLLMGITSAGKLRELAPPDPPLFAKPAKRSRQTFETESATQSKTEQTEKNTTSASSSEISTSPGQSSAPVRNLPTSSAVFNLQRGGASTSAGEMRRESGPDPGYRSGDGGTVAQPLSPNPLPGGHNIIAAHIPTPLHQLAHSTPFDFPLYSADLSRPSFQFNADDVNVGVNNPVLAQQLDEFEAMLSTTTNAMYMGSSTTGTSSMPMDMSMPDMSDRALQDMLFGSTLAAVSHDSMRSRDHFSEANGEYLTDASTTTIDWGISHTGQSPIRSLLGNEDESSFLLHVANQSSTVFDGLFSESNSTTTVTFPSDPISEAMLANVPSGYG